MRVAVLGSGAREHALAAKLVASPCCRELVVLPGNEGMARAGLKTAPVDLKDHAAVAAKLRELDIEFAVIGPDDLLAAGLVDDLEAEGLLAFGPKRAAARIESSKAFAKEMMEAAGIPTARHVVLKADDAPKLEQVVESLGGYPIVMKYDGLALGKGVRICVDAREGAEFVKEVFEDKIFERVGRSEASGSKDTKKTPPPLMVVEQLLSGHEVSVFALTDGKRLAVLEPSCDHKRLGEGNVGPNTGGMGAYSPVPWLGAEQLAEIVEKVFAPLLTAMREAKSSFKGLLYAGLMVRGRDFWVLEYNARFGDPETQAILPRLESDLLPLLYGIANGCFERNLDANPMRWSSNACVNVVAASRGYPEAPETGMKIEGVDDLLLAKGPRVYFAGVKAREGGLVTSGGRVLGVSALGESLDAARSDAMAALEKIRFEGMKFRRDVGSVRANY
ncbi:MAG: phosphoribosylamine--glycine ligase [Deltaproteobacteria bacterium]|nr:phosphoribosylamine--glycine ligase [Deltaproteobacteria bacterium]